MITERAKENLTLVFTMFGDYSLSERSHLIDIDGSKLVPSKTLGQINPELLKSANLPHDQSNGLSDADKPGAPQ